MEYCVIHGKDMYWTGEKIAAAPEKFRTFLAINQGRVIGYLDVTHCFEENEPYDIYVLPEYRRKGYGRKLLAKALDCNQPRGMMLLVETDNTAAIRLYELMNFKTVPGQNSLTPANCASYTPRIRRFGRVKALMRLQSSISWVLSIGSEKSGLP